ncbi:MAG: transcriptional regulator [Nitrospirae bacterium]|nr:transcriptional regulator [Nitrospirota bacterium]
MKGKPKEPAVPPERSETLRQLIIELIDGHALSAKEISGNAGVSVKEVYGHLDHIQKTVDTKAYRFSIVPAVCKKCGFMFRKRGRLKKPGRCPVCKGETIEEPLFEIDRTVRDRERHTG